MLLVNISGNVHNFCTGYGWMGVVGELGLSEAVLGIPSCAMSIEVGKICVFAFMVCGEKMR